MDKFAATKANSCQLNLVLDIGNTFSKIAWFQDGDIRESQRIRNEDNAVLMGAIKKYPAENIIVSSVSADYHVLFAEPLPSNTLFLNHHTPLPIKVLYQTPETLGLDRIAACVGAWHLFPNRNVLIIDAGTAITVDFINAQGEYLGGNISPGIQIRFKSLHEFTARLPLINNRTTPASYLGTDTPSAIAAGVHQGIIHELNGYLSDFDERHDNCQYILTGGDADILVSRMKKSIFVMPELVVRGLHSILEYNLTHQ
jgi:type III pantothenate kinase